MAKNNKKKKSANLSDLLNKYDVKNDINPEEFGVGGKIGAGYAGISKGIVGSIAPGPLGGAAMQTIDTVHGAVDKDIDDDERAINGFGQAAGAAGTAIATGGATAPQSIAVGAQGLGQGVAATDPTNQDMQMAGQGLGLAGQLGGMAAGQSAGQGMMPSGKMPGTYENGGDLTEYNGNTHDNGGIPITPDKEVEDKETRWEDYIFSEKVKVPTKKYSFADASKRINKKYSHRKNDKYDDAAKAKEMKALMGMQESERERMGLAHQDKLKEMFGNGGLVETDDDKAATTLPTDQSKGDISKLAKLTDDENFPLLSGWTDVQYERNNKSGAEQPTYSSEQGKLVEAEKDAVDKRNNDFRRYAAKAFGVPRYTIEDGKDKMGLPNPNAMDVNFKATPDQLAALDQERLQQYYKDLEWGRQHNRHVGFTPKQFYGDKEAEQYGYTDDTPLNELNFGIRMLTGNPNKQLESAGLKPGTLNDKQFKNGGPMNYNNGGFNRTVYDYDDSLNMPDTTNRVNGLDLMSEVDYTDPNMTNGTALNQQLKQASDLPSANGEGYVTGPQDNVGGGQGWQDLAMFGAQNMGNIHNITQGMTNPDKIELGRMSPELIDDSATLSNIEGTFNKARTEGAKRIRANTTSSGQTLSNQIANNVRLAAEEARQVAKIKENTANTNAGINNNAQRTNLDILSREEQLNAQTEGARQNALAQGLSGMGASAAGYARDQKATKQQDAVIQNFLRTGEYYIAKGPNGEDIMMSSKTGQPVNV